jgi:hypothetical protein
VKKGKAYPDTSASFLDALHVARDRDLVALFLMIASIAVGKMNVAAGLLHDFFYSEAALADYMRMIGVTDVQLHSHPVVLLTKDKWSEEVSDKGP